MLLLHSLSTHPGGRACRFLPRRVALRRQTIRQFAGFVDIQHPKTNNQVMRSGIWASLADLKYACRRTGVDARERISLAEADLSIKRKPPEIPM